MKRDRSVDWIRRTEMLHAVARECRFGAVGAVQCRRGAASFQAERGGMPLEVEVAVTRREAWTSVRVPCPGVPIELSLRPELPGEGVDKALGMTVDHEVGDAAFDARFVVEAAPLEVARLLLTAPVRWELMALLHTDDSPRVTLRGGSLVILWRGEATPAAVEHAVAAARALRDAAAELHEGIGAVVAAGPFRRAAGALAAVDPGARARARAQIARARSRAVAVVTAAGMVSLGFLASVLLGGRLVEVWRHVAG